MPRYVVLRHDHPRGLHWDLMLQAGSVLRVWALPCIPEPRQPVAAQALADHRLAYLDYEGPVSGGRGTVVQADAGDFLWEEDTPAEVRIACRGRLLRGQIRLASSDDSPGAWTCLYQPDEC